MLRFFAVLVLSTCALAQTGSIGGVVKYSNGAIAKGAVIQIEREDVRGESKTAKTDKRGHYQVNDLHPGPYRVVLTMGGHPADSADHVNVHSGATTPINLLIKIP